MFYSKRVLALLFMIMVIAISCKTTQLGIFSEGKKKANFQNLKLHSIIEIPYDDSFNGTKIGGLSGIDYDNKNKIFYVISDDRSEHNPSRFYTFSIPNIENDSPTVTFKSVTTLKNNMNKEFPSIDQYQTLVKEGKRAKFTTVDPESIRYYPKGKILFWSNEGERIIDSTTTILSDPSITAMDLNGKSLYNFQIPKFASSEAKDYGIQRNRGIEALSLTPDGKHIFVGLEGTLIQDIPKDPSLEEAVRILKYDTEYRGLKAAYAYPLEKVKISDKYYSFTIAEILATNDSSMIVIERLFHKNENYDNMVKLYQARITPTSTNVAQMKSLINDKKKINVLQKELLLDMNTLPVPIDNVEGITFGPKIGKQNSLILISDNNFNPKQKTIIYILTY